MNCDGSNPFNNNSSCNSEDLVFELTSVKNENNEMLPVDNDNNFLFEWVHGPTHVLLELTTNLEGSNYINWKSDTEYCVEHFNETICIDVVNPQSVTSDNGIANQTMGIWEEMINDTITVYSHYMDWCQIEHIDSLKLIINNDF